MATLEQKYETFAQGLAYGFTPSKAADNAGLNISPAEAGHLTTDKSVRDRVAELLGTQHFDMGNEHIRVARQLEIDRDFAYAMGNPAAAINATIHRAKVLGAYVEQTNVNQNIAVSSPSKLTAAEWAERFGPKPSAPVPDDDDEGLD